MAKIQIKTLEANSKMNTLDEETQSKIVGGLSWHVYKNAEGKVIGSVYSADGDDTVYVHSPT
ncbi:hypothetical protein [Nostoc sp. WHI]|uniref:hypothetical protein n=1 Tax=Nostoc sp. WHI TaxID=2650611 RepID=UPI0018C65204|nr:hypothetical protein [Nostoc sp. WHI]MBG1271296.1 hypothetical protein [Nostoc sp. WHI]